MVPAESQSSARLGLPYLQAGQMQKHVTLNEALARLDGLVQTAVVSRTIGEQPDTPEEGALHILPEGVTGDQWSAFTAGDLVRHETGQWSLIPVAPGALVYVLDEARLIARGDSDWDAVSPALDRLDDLEGLGVGTASDEINPFSARLNGALWTALAEDDGGTGDLRYVLNKESGAHVLSMLFQSGWSGRAEIGLIGDEDLALKVSPDGDVWRRVIRADRHTGALHMHGVGALTGEASMAVLEALPAFPGRRRAFLIDDLITTLEEEGIWERLDLFYMLAATDEAAACVNWRQPGVHDLTFVGAAFQRDRGFQGNGSSAYLTAGCGFADLTGYAQTDATLFSWSLTDHFENGRPDFGAAGGASSSIYSGSAAGNLGTAINGSNLNTAVPASSGLSSVSRSGSDVTIYKNGDLTAATTQSPGSIATGDVTVLRAGGQYTTRRIAVAGCGRSLDENQHRVLHHALCVHLSALGAL